MKRRCWWPMAAVGWLCLAEMQIACAVGETTHELPTRRALAAKVDEYMKASVQHDAFSGTILIARNGTPVLVKSYGMANYELDVPNTPQTVFRIASLTKAFTALLVMQLQDEGKLDVHDLICKYLSDCPAAWQSITIRQLLTHTSGIKNYSSLDDWDEVLGRKDYRHGGQMELIRELPLEFAPGEKYKYSNSGYFLLGLIIERVSGKSYEQLLSERIFVPLGMKHSTFNPTRSLNPNRATGYYSSGTSFVNARYLSPTLDGAEGGINSTVGDLLLWDQALYSDKLVSRKALDEIFTPEKGGYGYGWQISEKFGRKRVDHPGSINGFSTYIVRFPTDRMTVIVLSNSDKTSAGRTGTDLAAIAFGEPYKLPIAPLGDLLWDTAMLEGVASAIQQYHDLQRTQQDKYDFSHHMLVSLGYELLEANRLTEAKAIFDFSVETFPQEAYAYDGLADVADLQGNTQLAMAHLEKSVKLDPANTYAMKALERLRRGKTAPAQQSNWAIPSNEDIRTLLAKRMEHNGVGVVVGVIEPAGRRVVAYGKSGAAEGRPLDGDTVFQIGSVSKSFVGLVLADMVLKGEVKLDDPAAKYLPAGVKMPQRGRPITLIDLDLHVSGLPRMPTNFDLHAKPDPTEAYSVDDLYRFLSTYVPLREPGGSYEYSNLGASLLGRLLGLRAGKEYEDLLKERVLVPLGMTSTSVHLSAEQTNRLVPGHAQDLLPVHSPEMKTLYASGSLRSSANDLLKFLAANLGYEDTPLKQAMAFELTVPTVPTTLGPQVPGTPQQGLGWKMIQSMGRQLIFHEGDKNGYRCVIAFDPERRTGVVVIENAFTDDAPRRIARYLLTGEPMPPPPPAVAVKKFVQVDAALLDRYEGEYRVGESLLFRVARRADHLFIDEVARGPEEYFAEGPRNFSMRAERRAVTFRTDAAGEVIGLAIYPRGRGVNDKPLEGVKLRRGAYP